MSKQEEEDIFYSKEKVILNRIKTEYDKLYGESKNKPAKLKLAEIHEKACKVGKPKKKRELRKGEQIQYCGCCARQVQKRELNILCNNMDLSFLGAGYVSYLEFIKFCIGFLVFFFLSSGLFNIITNSAIGDDCLAAEEISHSKNANAQCTKNWVTVLSLGNKRSRDILMESQSLFNLLSIIVSIVVFQKYRFRLRQIEQMCDEKIISPSDYAIVLSNIPQVFSKRGEGETDYREILLEFLKKNLCKNQNDQNLKFNKNIEDKSDNGNEDQENQTKKEKQYQDSPNKQQNSCNNSDEEKSDTDSEEKVKQNIHQKEEKEIELYGIGLCLELEEFNSLETKIKKELDLQKELKKQKKQEDGKSQQIQSKINNYKKQQEQLHKQYDEIGTDKLKLKNFTGLAYLILQNESDKKRILEYYQEVGQVTSFFTGLQTNELIFQGQEIYISPPPNPSNVCWENLRFSSTTKTVKRGFLFLVTLMVLGGCFGLLFSFQYLQLKVGAEDFDDTIWVSVISYTISVCVILLNFGVQYIITFISKKESRSTLDSYYISVVIKHGIAQFLNTSVLLFIIQVFIYRDGDGYGKLFKSGGLAYNMNSIFMTQMVVQNVVQMVNIPYILQKSKKLGLIKTGFWKSKSQEDLNLKYENPQFDLQGQYSILISQILSAMFYAPIIPISLIWIIIQLSVKYFVDKYQILHKSTSNLQSDINISQEMIELLEYSLPIYSLANLLFFIYISPVNKVDQVSILGALVGIFHAFLPMHVLNQKIFGLTTNTQNQKKYSEVYLDFFTDYDRENPIYKEQALKKHQVALKFRAKKENKLVINQIQN